MTLEFGSSWSWNSVTFSVSFYSRLLDSLHDYVWPGDEEDEEWGV
jgi:hypothetical protein